MTNTVRRVEFVNEDSPQGSKFHGAEMDQRVRAYMAKHREKSYSAALAAVAKSDRALAAEYAKVDRDAHRADSFDPKYRSRMGGGDSSSGLPRERVPSQAEIAIDRGEAGAEVHRRTMELMRTPEYRGISYEDALTAVLQGDPELAERYRSFAGNFGDMGWQGQEGK